MNNLNDKHQMVLAMYPNNRGFGFAIFEGPQKPIDWGIKEAKVLINQHSLEKFTGLLDFYVPDIVVIEVCDAETSLRSERIRQLLQEVENLCIQTGKRIHKLDKGNIKDIFSMNGAKTKYEIAKVITTWFPELSLKPTKYRRPWMTEDYRQGIFDAMALAITYYYIKD